LFSFKNYNLHSKVREQAILSYWNSWLLQPVCSLFTVLIAMKSRKCRGRYFSGFRM